jgi:hypothetical protein
MVKNYSHTLVVLVDTDVVVVAVAVTVAMPGLVGIAVGRNTFAQREDPAGKPQVVAVAFQGALQPTS